MTVSTSVKLRCPQCKMVFRKGRRVIICGTKKRAGNKKHKQRQG